MDYDYDAAAMRHTLQEIIAGQIATEEWHALRQREERFEQDKKIGFFNLTFTAIPRIVEKKIIIPDEVSAQKLQNIRKEFSIEKWTIDRLTRTWWLLLLPAADQALYVKQVENLFMAAEMNEQVALYGALPLLAHPKYFRKRAAEGLRTNIRQVFEAIALNNPYPAAYFEEAAWNQMVLKAFFMDIAVNEIIGLDQRANETLAHILSDYAHERWAAGRPVNPLLWRSVGPFIDDKVFPDIQKLFQSEDEKEIKAAALASANSKHPPAQALLQKHAALKKQIEDGVLTWENL